MRPAVRLAPGRPGPAGLAPLILAILCAAFLAGAVMGAFTSSAAAGEAAAAIGEDGQVYGYDTFLEHLFGCAKYHVLVLLFATSVFGAVLIPAALAFRGFALACSAAGIAAAYPGRGVLLAAVALGLPAVLTVPALFLLAFDGFAFSARLSALCLRRTPPAPFLRGDDRALAAAAALFLAAAVECFAVPPLVRLIL